MDDQQLADQLRQLRTEMDMANGRLVTLIWLAIVVIVIGFLAS